MAPQHAPSTCTTAPRGPAAGVTLGQAAGRRPRPQQRSAPVLTLPPPLVLAKALWAPKPGGGAQVSELCLF